MSERMSRMRDTATCSVPMVKTSFSSSTGDDIVASAYSLACIIFDGSTLYCVIPPNVRGLDAFTS